MPNTKQIKCPSCGAALNLKSLYELIVTCPYCHQQVVNDIYQSASGKDKEPRVLEFKKSEEDVITEMVNMLIKDQSVPTDMFNKMSICAVKKYYIPIYIFEGTYRAPWTSKITRKERRQRIGSDGKIENYEETLYDYQNGEAAGNFEFNDIPSKIIDQLHLKRPSLYRVNVNPTTLPPFSSIQIQKENNMEFVNPCIDSEAVWRDSGKRIAIGIGRDAALSQSSSQGYTTNYSVSCELEKTSFVYIPLWIIEYKYEDVQFSFKLYGEQVNEITSPKREKVSAEATEEQQAILDKNKKRYIKISNTTALGLFIIAVIAIIGFIGFAVYQHQYNYNSKISGGGFFWTMVCVGIVWYFFFSFLSSYFDEKDGIGEINKDIANRTQLLQAEADNYRLETGKRFLNKYAGKDFQNIVNGNYDKAESNTHTSTFYETNIPKTKTCVRCSKQININHGFCRYCGAKQN